LNIYCVASCHTGTGMIIYITVVSILVLHPRRRSKVSIENEQAMMSASYFQVVSQLQHLVQAATTHVTTNSKQGFDLIVAAAVSDNHLAGGIDCLIARAQPIRSARICSALSPPSLSLGTSRFII
jgi:hypothetical protein